MSQVRLILTVIAAVVFAIAFLWSESPTLAGGPRNLIALGLFFLTISFLF